MDTSTTIQPPADDNGTTAERPQDDSALGRLKARRQELLKDRTTDIPVLGYGGDLVIRYGALEWEEIRRIGRRVDKDESERAELNGHADILLAACREVLARRDGELGPIDPDRPVETRFDQHLAQLLEFDAESARDVLFGVFANDVAVSTTHNLYAAWLNRTEDEAADEFVGESLGGARFSQPPE